MGLEELAQLGWYKAEPTSAREVADLFSIVSRCLDDAAVKEISDDLRFQAAYNGILTLSNIPLRASGYRVSQSQGHHQRTIESLEYTLTTVPEEARAKWVRKIKAHAQKRNVASYDLAGGVSPTELAQITKDLGALKMEVIAWLQEAHPGLVPVGRNIA